MPVSQCKPFYYFSVKVFACAWLGTSLHAEQRRACECEARGCKPAHLRFCRCLIAIRPRLVMFAVGISIGVWAGQLGMHACPQAFRCASSNVLWWTGCRNGRITVL